jgi:hypothetical protein
MQRESEDNEGEAGCYTLEFTQEKCPARLSDPQRAPEPSASLIQTAWSSPIADCTGESTSVYWIPEVKGWIHSDSATRLGEW